MTDHTTLASIQASIGKVASLIDQTSLDGDIEHADLYVTARDDGLIVAQSAGGGSVTTFASFDADYFSEFEVSVDPETRPVTDPHGNEVEVAIGAEAILPVADVLTYINFAADAGEQVTLDLTTDSNGRLASHVRAIGPNVNSWTALPGSQSILDQVPLWVLDRFDDDERYLSPAGDPAPTEIEVKANQIDRIIEMVDADDRAEFYPIVVEDGDLLVDIGDEASSGVSGVLPTLSIEGPDVDNSYHDGFESVFSVVDGRVRLQTGPGGNPMAVVKDRDDHVIRHVVGSVKAN